LTSRDAPKGVLCPDCGLKVHDNWNPSYYLDSEFPNRDVEWWSDGVLITQHTGPLRSLVKCPHCWAVMPYFALREALKTGIDGAPYDRRFPFLPGIGRTLEAAGSQWYPEVENCNFKTWRMVAQNSLSAQDPIFDFLIAESVLQSFNDRIRAKARDWHGAGYKEDISGTKLIRRFKECGLLANLQSTELSEAFACSIGSFVGEIRFTLLVAEIARMEGDYALAESRLDSASQLLESRGVRFSGNEEVPEVEFEPSDSPLEFGEVENLSANWLRVDSAIRLQQMKFACSQENQGLLRVNRIAAKHPTAVTIRPDSYE
jgi:hypothetical protein